jgi:steroid delta-isomerase-like uncharacterized protein
MMSTNKNKVIVRRLWEQVWNQNELAVCDEIFAADYAEHEKRVVPALRAAFPDLQFEIQDMIAENDKVVTRYIMTGTHQGEFMGIPATGNAVRVRGIWIHRLTGDRIVEGRDWGLWDALGLMRQIGAMTNLDRNESRNHHYPFLSEHSLSDTA